MQSKLIVCPTCLGTEHVGSTGVKPSIWHFKMDYCTFLTLTGVVLECEISNFKLDFFEQFRKIKINFPFLNLFGQEFKSFDPSFSVKMPKAKLKKKKKQSFFIWA